MRKILSNLINFISVLLIVFAVFVLMNVVMTKPGNVPDIAGYSILRVLTGSMEPAIPTNSIILIHKTEPAEVKVGDVISFYSSDPALRGSVNTHRVIEIEKDNDRTVYVTKGDANAVKDEYLPTDLDLIGVVVGTSYLVGVLIRLLSNPMIFFPLVLLPLILLLIVSMVNAVRSAREIARKEEAEAIQAALAEARRLQQLKKESESQVQLVSDEQSK